MQVQIEDVSNRTPLLMTPGPTEVGQKVLDALSKRPMLHYGEEWRKFYASVLELMRDLFDGRSDDQIILVPAPGSACMEMAITNLASPGEKILNLRNGYFGELTRDCALDHGINVIEPDVPYGKPISTQEVRMLIEENKDIVATVVIHNETSAGVVNPVEEIGKICRQHGIPLIVDTISSFGAVRTSVRDLDCAICVGYPSKALSGIAGVVPVAIRAEIWENAVRNSSKRDTGRFLGFKIWDHYIREWGPWGHPFPATMPTSVIQALRVAAEVALEEGIDARSARHREISAKFRRMVRDMGLEILPEESISSPTVTAISLSSPEQDGIRSIMEKEFGIMISGGLSALRGKIIRVGHMGLTATDACIARTSTALRKSLAIISR